MAIAINGSGTMTGISVGGLPDGIVDAGTLATNSVDSDELINGSIDAGHLASGVGGKIVQVVNTQSSAFASGTTQTPMDGTIPQNTEGNEFLTLAITPTNSSNKLLIKVHLYNCNSDSGRVITVALFQDSTANALAVDAWHQSAANGNASGSINFDHYMTAGTTSSTTFKVRAGANGSGTMMMNGSHSGDLDHGATTKSSITIWEIAV